MAAKCCGCQLPSTILPSRYSEAVLENAGGALDVILVEQPNGGLRSTDWHVVFDSLETSTAVEVQINGQPLKRQPSLRASAPNEPAEFEGGGVEPPASLLADLVASLAVKPGRNTLRYVLAGSDKGVRCSIYLWKKGTRGVVFDVDGTVTVNDAAGQMGNLIDQSFVHKGVCELACQLDARGYNLVFLTSRTLLGVAGADRTRRYLLEVVVDAGSGYRMPEAPVITTRCAAALGRR
eukprot:7241612-Prymnesium_polylepis.1